jgi:protein Tob/BTG
VVVHACNPSSMGGISRRIMVYDSLGKKIQDPIWKITKAERSQNMQELLAEHYKQHWFPEKPWCIRINHKMSPQTSPKCTHTLGWPLQSVLQNQKEWLHLSEASPAGGRTQNNSKTEVTDSRISSKEELLLGRTSPSKTTIQWQTVCEWTIW